MAHVFAGNQAIVDEEVLAAIETLGDDFWVFSNFSVGREIDWFIVRESSDGQAPSTLIVVELKRSERSIRARGQDSPWEKEGPDGSWEPFANERDTNPYWQAVNSANVLKSWLWNNQRHFLPDETETVPEDSFKNWPEVLILSPSTVRHYLPIRPESRFGAWFTSLDAWLQSVLTWKPKEGIALSGTHLERLATTLSLSELAHKQPAEEPQPSEVEPGRQFLDWLQSMQRTIADLKTRVEQLEKTSALSAIARPALQGPIIQRPLTPDERHALVSSVQHAARLGSSRATPAIISRMEQFLGYSLKERGYNGFGTATRMLDQARTENIVQFGPKVGPNVTLYLISENAPPESP